MFFNSFFQEGGFDDPNFGYEYEAPRRHVDNQRLYDVLGVPNDATDGQIRKAYLILAKKYHPDKGGDPKKFQDISTAYEILSNKEQRHLYDRYGEEGIKSMDHQRSPRNEVSRTKNIKKEVNCSLEDLYKGKTFCLSIFQKVVCRKCNGEGGSNGYRIPCRHCNGTGVTTVDIGDFIFVRHRMETECQYCNGAGAYFNNNLQCPDCCGKRLVREKKEMEIYLQPGMGTGSVIRLAEAADEAPGMIAGDILLLIKEKPHALFKRNGPDLRITMNVSLGEAMCGFVRSIQHLDGRTIFISCNPGEVRPGCVKRIENEGMPIEGSVLRHGSLFIDFNIDYPNHLSDEQINMLRTVFNVPLPVLPQNVDVYQAHDASPEMFGHSVPDYVPPKEAYDEDSSDGYTSQRNDCPIQ